ncbi:MAG: toll/interleukin-1 receptor domain-containing protein [Planctomycetota bacterium]|jgi:hypothetical protein
MSHVFLSYSQNDHIFAELASVKLKEAGISVWMDQDELRAGNDWRQGIDQGISESFAVLLALSTDSAASSFVTYEWASAMGKGKPIIPIRINECQVHPKLEPIQHLDFSIPRQLPWADLIERVKEIERDSEIPEHDQAVEEDKGAEDVLDDKDPIVESILTYLNQRGYQMVSFDRIRRRIDENLSDEHLEGLIKQHRRILRPARLKGGKPGMAKL